jgi:hypothetical protein
MRKVLSLGAIVTLAGLAAAGGEKVHVEVGPIAPASRPAIVNVSNTIPPAYSNQLLCNLRRSDRIDRMLNDIVNQTLSSVRTINKEDVAVSLIELCPDDGGPAAIGHVNGDHMLYASGLARLPYAAALYNANGGNLPASTEAAVKASLRDGDFDAANSIAERLRARKGGEGANYFLATLGMEDFNVNQRFITSDPEGADAARLGRKLHMNYENSNRMTSNQAAGLFYLLAHDALVSPYASQALKAYMHHPLEQKKIGPLAGIADGLPVGAEIITLNGFTVRNYHEAALVKLPNGKRYVLSVMTKYNNYPTVFTPLLSRTIAFRMMTSTGSEDPALHTYIPARAR